MHQLNYHIYHCSKTKKSIEKELNKFAEEYSDNHVPLPNPIVWQDKNFKTEEEAVQYIQDRRNGFYEQIAVSYKVGRKKYWLVKTEIHV